MTAALKRIKELTNCVKICYFNQPYLLLFKISPELDSLLNENQIELTHFAFRWVYCLLVREFPLTLAMRILDTYISDEDGFASLHIYACTNLLLKCFPYVCFFHKSYFFTRLKIKTPMI